MFTLTWIRDTLERMVATFVQAAVGAWILDAGADIPSFNYRQYLLAGAVAAGAALLKAIAATQVGDPDSASLDPGIHVQSIPPP